MNKSIEDKKRELAGRGFNLKLTGEQILDAQWIYHRKNSSIDDYYECPCCGAKFDDINGWNFCPVCGTMLK